MFPQLNLLQGILLWSIVVISYCILTKGAFAVSFKSTPELSDDEIDSIIKSAKISTKMRMLNKAISKNDKFTSKNPYVEELKTLSKTESDKEDNISNVK
jgi:hypothetical protein